MDSHGDATHLLRGRIGQVDIGSVVGVKGAGGEAGGEVGEAVAARPRFACGDCCLLRVAC